MKLIATICARAGSKGVTHKNIRTLLGKPLIAHTIMQAIDSGLFDAIVITSDSEAILEIGKQHGANFLIKRPNELATDSAPKIPAIQHCVSEVEKMSGQNFDIVIDLDPTSPLRLTIDIEAALELFKQKKVSNLISVSPSRKSPYFNLVEVDEKGVAHLSKALKHPVVRRQDTPKCYDINGSIYIWKREALKNSGTSVFLKDTIVYIMPEERSIDIDTELDFEMVEFLLTKRLTLQTK